MTRRNGVAQFLIIRKRKWIVVGVLLVGILVIVLKIFFASLSKESVHFAIIPHFMLDSEKVDAFYAFLKEKRYADHDPETIVILSPNHYHQLSSAPQTLCEESEVYFGNQKYQLTPFPGVACDEQIFYQFGNVITTREHGIGEHLPRIANYFSEVQQIIPLILPTHLFPLSPSASFDNKKILYLASVDFSHYLPEEIAQANDAISIATLQSGTGTRADFSQLDVDCPACLYVLNHIASAAQQKAQLWWRDSSTTLLGHEMEEENTSRVFMWYE